MYAEAHIDFRGILGRSLLEGRSHLTFAGSKLHNPLSSASPLFSPSFFNSFDDDGSGGDKSVDIPLKARMVFPASTPMPDSTEVKRERSIPYFGLGQKASLFLLKIEGCQKKLKHGCQRFVGW